MSFIVALFTDTSIELMSGAKSREWVHHNSTNQPTNQSSSDMRTDSFSARQFQLAIKLSRNFYESFIIIGTSA